MAIDGVQGLAKRDESVAIARRGGVGREVELSGDLLKGEFTPDLKDQDLALLRRKPSQRAFDGGATVITFNGRFEKRLSRLKPVVMAFFPSRAARLTAAEINRGAADRGDEQRQRLAPEPALMPPKPHERLLHHILRIGRRTRPLPGAQQEFRAVKLKPRFPRFMFG